MKALDDFRLISSNGDLAGWIHKDISVETLKPLLDDPEGFLNVSRSEILRDKPKTKVVKQSFNTEGVRKRDVVIKRFQYPSLWRRIGFLFLSSPALRCLRGSLLLIEHGIATASPLAALQHPGLKSGGTSYYITEEIKDGRSLDTFWAETVSAWTRKESLCERSQILNEVALLFYRLHSCSIYHRDLKGSNILIRKRSESAWQCLLVDVGDISKKKRLARRRRLKNLVQLLRTFGQHLNVRERVYLVKRYADLISLPRDRRRAFVNLVLSASQG
jgi:serine/threonine protein kinase